MNGLKGLTPVRHAVHAVQTEGHPVPEDLRVRAEALLGEELAQVRIFVDPQVRTLGARAFTTGSRIHFAPGEYNPSTLEGVRVLGHELAHVVQQRQGRVRNRYGYGVEVVEDATLEAEAERMGWMLARTFERSVGGSLQKLALKETPAYTLCKERGVPELLPGICAECRHGLCSEHIAALLAAGVQCPHSTDPLEASPETSDEQEQTVQPLLGATKLPEWLKEYIDFRRWSINPYWMRENRIAREYELAHPAYHSVARHGGEHTLANIRARTQGHPVPGRMRNRSAMVNVMTGTQNIPSNATSSRFATDAWHNYTRQQAIHRLAAIFGGVYVWPATQPAPTLPMGVIDRATFNITYTDNTVGFSVDAANPNGVAVSTVHTMIQYDRTGGEAWVVQHFPCAAPYGNNVAGIIPDLVIPSDAVPWL